MWIEQPAAINEQLLLLGSPELPIYLLEGQRLALLEGGMKLIDPVLRSQLAEAAVDTSRLDLLVILHSHHDHVGLVPSLRRSYPHLRVAASATAAAQLADAEVIDAINQVNDLAIELAGRTGRLGDCEAAITAIPVDLQWRDGDRYDLGGLHLQVIAAPGHSDDTIAIQVPELDALFISDAGGLKLSETAVFPLPSGDLDTYLATLERLRSLKPRLLGLGHFGVATGDDAAAFFEIALATLHKLTAELQLRRLDRVGLEGFAAELVQRDGYERLGLMPQGVILETLRRLASTPICRNAHGRR